VPDHPYRSQPARAFWSRAVARGFDPGDVATPTEPLLERSDRVMSAGSCFASNMIPWLERSGIEYVRTEPVPAIFAPLPENLGYRNFSAAYGNIYTARHLRQLLERSLGRFTPTEDRWHVDGRVVDPFRPGLRYPARSDAEFDLLTRQHLDAVLEAVRRSTVLVFTLGLTEGWCSTADGAAYPACPGTVAGEYDLSRHEFRNFTVDEVTDDLLGALDLARTVNPSLRLILTVSPVPLVATATDEHVLTATTYSKAVLRVAATQVCRAREGVRYFPAYELVTGPQAPGTFYAEDRRDVTEEAVAVVMGALFGPLSPAPGGDADGAAAAPATDGPALHDAGSLSRAISEAECDEVLMDWQPGS
jgi:hypothetical protein